MYLKVTTGSDLQTINRFPCLHQTHVISKDDIPCPNSEQLPIVLICGTPRVFDARSSTSVQKEATVSLAESILSSCRPTRCLVSGTVNDQLKPRKANRPDVWSSMAEGLVANIGEVGTCVYICLTLDLRTGRIPICSSLRTSHYLTDYLENYHYGF
jgi:hypothetical protein